MNKRVQFINVLHPEHDSVSSTSTVDIQLLYIHTPYYFLKSFYKLHGKHYKNYEWMPTYEIKFSDNLFNIEKLFDHIKNNDIDIVCFSIYIWNNLFCTDLINQVKERFPEIIIIIGGPDVEFNYLEQDIINRNKLYNINWSKLIKDSNLSLKETSIKNSLKYLRKKYKNVDYIIYSEGEEAFQLLMDSFIEPIDITTIPNLITKEFITPHVAFQFEKYDPYSPYLTLKEDFINEYNYKKNKIEGNQKYYKITIAYEIMRGCPYACTFCSDRIGRVSKKKFDWRFDLDFFSQFSNIDIRLVDTNSGITQEYIDFFKYAEKYMNPNWGVTATNLAKLSNERVYEIAKIEGLNTVSNALKVSLQHLDHKVLENINRPDMSWDKRRKILKDIISHTKKEIMVELIQGLPGAHLNNTIPQYLKLIEVPVHTTILYPWQMLHNSIANEIGYREKYNLNVIDIIFPYINTELDITILELYNNIKTNQNLNFNITKLPILYQKDVSIKDYFYMFYYDILYNVLASDFNLSDCKNDKDRIQKFDQCVNVANKFINGLADLTAKKFITDTNNHGMFIWGLEINGKIRNLRYYCNTALHTLFEKHFSKIIQG